ncbi:hypothetical protein AB9P05_18270 [Roseivirga sp. BDSF3-8]|uniref:hypothetical protein n=1 Tax=Roseivirga sp. BDSF3-8 TaxID=3241598 RepID=UPI0035322C60
MGKIVNMLWVISLIAFLGAFLVVYAYLPGEVAINSDAGGRGNQFVSKEMFFYGGIGFFMLTNIVLYLFSRLIHMEASRMNSNNRGSGLFHFRNRLAVWIKGLTILINLFFITISLFIGIFNSTDNVGTMDYVLLIYLIPVLIVGWLIYLGVIISGAVKRT